MSTLIYSEGLQLFIEAQEHGGANGSTVSAVSDLSVNNRDLVAVAPLPTIETGAINGKRAFVWDGTKNPLKYSGSFRINSGFLVVRINGAFAGDYEGIISSLINYGLLTGIGSSSIFYDFQYNFFEYRLNDRIYPKENYLAPISTWGIIFFRIYQGLTLDGFQIGQDRTDTDSLADMKLAMLALYDRNWCESDIRNNTESIAHSYQIAIENVFPFQGSKTDSGTIDKDYLTDGTRVPVIRVKNNKSWKEYDLSFAARRASGRDSEWYRARAFHEEYYPSKTFIYQDYNIFPPESNIFRITSALEDRGNTGVNKNYGFSVAEALELSAPQIPDAVPLIDTEAPGVPEILSVVAESETSLYLNWTASTDNVGVAGYEVLIDTLDVYNVGNVTNYSFDIFGAGTTHSFQVRAYDAAGNRSAWSVAETGETDEPPDSTPPSAPANLTAGKANSTQIDLDWDAATDNVAVTGYELRRATDSGFTTGVTDIPLGNVLTYSNTGLTPSTTYYYKVRARDAEGNWSAYSNVDSDTTDAPAPTNWADISTGGTATATSTSAWSAASGAFNGLRHTNSQWGSNSAAGHESSGTATVGTPQILERDFGTTRTINEINIITIADAVQYNTNPTLSDTFSSYGIENFTADYWNGASWVNIQTITGNNKVWRQFTFSSISTTKVRLPVTKGKDNAVARVVEFEAIG